MRVTALDTEERLRARVVNRKLHFPALHFQCVFVALIGHRKACRRWSNVTLVLLPYKIYLLIHTYVTYQFICIAALYGKFIEEIFFVSFTLRLRIRNLSSMWVSIHKIIFLAVLQLWRTWSNVIFLNLRLDKWQRSILFYRILFAF